MGRDANPTGPRSGPSGPQLLWAEASGHPANRDPYFSTLPYAGCQPCSGVLTAYQEGLFLSCLYSGLSQKGRMDMSCSFALLGVSNEAVCTFFVAVTFEVFLPNDTRIQNFWEALSNFTSGEQPQFFPHSSCAARWAWGQGTHCPVPWGCSPGTSLGLSCGHSVWPLLGC